jgi:ribosomal protein L44E
MKKIIYCRYCDRLTKKQVEQMNKKSIDLVTSTKQCENCKTIRGLK